MWVGAVRFLVLATHATGDVRRRLVDAAARLSPPPTAVRVDAVSNEQLWSWFDTSPYRRPVVVAKLA